MSSPRAAPKAIVESHGVDIERLLQGRLHDPRRVLGLHVANGRAVVRVLLPNVSRVRLVTPDVELERVPGTALFEWTGDAASVRAPYRVRWQAHDGAWVERYDPYSFPLHIEEHDLGAAARADLLAHRAGILGAPHPGEVG